MACGPSNISFNSPIFPSVVTLYKEKNLLKKSMVDLFFLPAKSLEYRPCADLKFEFYCLYDADSYNHCLSQGYLQNLNNSQSNNILTIRISNNSKRAIKSY